jgi:hypothetical protein
VCALPEHATAVEGSCMTEVNFYQTWWEVYRLSMNSILVLAPHYYQARYPPDISGDKNSSPRHRHRPPLSEKGFIQNIYLPDLSRGTFQHL